MAEQWMYQNQQQWSSSWVKAHAEVVNWLHSCGEDDLIEPTPPRFESAAEADAWLEAHPAVHRD